MSVFSQSIPAGNRKVAAMKISSVLGKLWALPTTVIFGMSFGFLGVLIAPRKVRIRLENNAICFFNHPLLRGRAFAVTLGNVIAFQFERADVEINNNGTTLGEHERQHTLQAEMLGIFYIPLYLILMPKYGCGKQHPMECGPYNNPPRPW